MTDHEPERDPEVDRTFGEGQDHEPAGEEGEPRRRFSEGQEELPARSHKVDDPTDYDPERNPDAEGRFSEGQEELAEKLSAAFARRPLEAWLELFEHEDVCVGPVWTREEAAAEFGA